MHSDRKNLLVFHLLLTPVISQDGLAQAPYGVAQSGSMTANEPGEDPLVALSSGPEPEFLTVPEAAALLRVPEQTVRNELAARRLPGKKIGKE